MDIDSLLSDPIREGTALYIATTAAVRCFVPYDFVEGKRNELDDTNGEEVTASTLQRHGQSECNGRHDGA